MSARQVLRSIFSRIITRPHIETSDLHFPIEIWELIITCLSEITGPLFPLLTIHSALHRAVERVLYRHIDLSGDFLKQAPRRIALFNRLVNNQGLARLVESFVLPPLITPEKSKTRFYRDADKYYYALHLALCAMTQLRILVLGKLSTSQNWGGMPHHRDPIFYGCKFRLHQLSLGPFTKNRVALMEDQQLLIRDLSLNHRLEQGISEAAFPDLQILEVTTRTDQAPSLLRGGNRPIQALYWTAWDPILVGGPYLKIRSLRLGILDGLDITQLCEAFPSLRYLRLDFHVRIDQDMIDHMPTLSHLHSIRKLVLGGWGVLEWQSIAIRRRITISLFSDIPSLHSVSFGLELWERERGDNVTLVSNPLEWKEQGWWD